MEAEKIAERMKKAEELKAAEDAAKVRTLAAFREQRELHIYCFERAINVLLESRAKGVKHEPMLVCSWLHHKGT